MTTLKSTSGKKIVNIYNNQPCVFMAIFIQVDEDNQREQVLESKTYSTLKGAEKWAKSKLN